jgi:hypothetical protein
MDMLISKYAWISIDIKRYLYTSMISKCSNSLYELPASGPCWYHPAARPGKHPEGKLTSGHP